MEMNHSIVLKLKIASSCSQVMEIAWSSPIENRAIIGLYGFTKRYQIPFEAVGVGKYLIEWRGLGEDGHALNGNFSFTVE